MNYKDIIKLNFEYRFDLMAKLLYAKHPELDWFKKLYLFHILTLNGACENEPHHVSPAHNFVSCFDNLILSMCDSKKFDRSFPIPVGDNFMILDGAHRLALCFLYDIEPHFELQQQRDVLARWNFKNFLTRLQFPIAVTPLVLSNMEENYMDRMALEYCLNFTNFKIICLFPAAEFDIEGLLSSIGTLYYKKEIILSQHGLINLTYELYRGEEWIGGFFPNSATKGVQCSGKQNLRVFMFIPSINVTYESLRAKINDLYGVQNHFVHIHDTYEEGLRIAKSVFNQNSIHFLQKSKFILSDKEKKMIQIYYDELQKKPPLQRELFGIDTSFVLALYGIRHARDLDYIALGSSLTLADANVEMHDDAGSAKYFSKKELILNPENHFYVMGLKVLCLDVIKRTKKERGEKKDLIDIALITQFLEGTDY